MTEIRSGLPPRSGLYDPALEHDACGVGFVANIRGVKSHDVVHRGVVALERLQHRGACGCDPETGDGAGILIQLPDRFLRREAAKLGIALPALGAYASGMVFLSRDADTRAWQERNFAEVVRSEQQSFLGWRDVPVEPQAIGRMARESMPHLRQVFVGAAPGCGQDEFERKLFVIRRVFENACQAQGGFCYIPSLSSRTFVYIQFDHGGVTSCRAADPGAAGGKPSARAGRFSRHLRYVTGSGHSGVDPAPR